MGASWGTFGASHKPLGVSLGLFWPLGASWEPFWLCYGVPGPSDAVGSRFGGLSEPTWGPLGAPQGRLGGHIGLLGGHLGPSWPPFGPSWGHLGPSWGHLGGHLGDVGAILRASLAVLGRLKMEKMQIDYPSKPKEYL